MGGPIHRPIEGPTDRVSIGLGHRIGLWTGLPTGYRQASDIHRPINRRTSGVPMGPSTGRTGRGPERAAKISFPQDEGRGPERGAEGRRPTNPAAQGGRGGAREDKAKLGISAGLVPASMEASMGRGLRRVVEGASKGRALTVGASPGSVAFGLLLPWASCVRRMFLSTLLSSIDEESALISEDTRVLTHIDWFFSFLLTKLRNYRRQARTNECTAPCVR